MSVHVVGGRGRRFLYRYAPRTTCWRSVGDLTESVGLMREASRRGFARDRVLERSARRVPTRRSVALAHNVEAMAARRRVEYPWI